jgi:hypothetical protein
MGRANPNQNTASIGDRASVRTPPIFDPCQTSHAAQPAASVTARNASQEPGEGVVPDPRRPRAAEGPEEVEEDGQPRVPS